MKPAVIVTKDQITATFDDGVPKTVHSSHPNFDIIWEKLKNDDYEDLESYFSIARMVNDYTLGNITVSGDKVYYKSSEVHNSLTRRIVDFIKNDFPVNPLIRFLDKLMGNPSKRSVEQLYDYLERYQLPLTDDGNFWAYKAVSSELFDIKTGKIRNYPGDIISMSQNQVDDDPDSACSDGLHCGNINYILSYGSMFPGSRYILIEVNPADVVSCPKHSSWEKLRVCRYEVIKEVPYESVKPFMNEYVGSWDNPISNEDDDDLFDEDGDLDLTDGYNEVDGYWGDERDFKKY